MEGKNEKPGDGIRSMRSSTLFRATNFELYAKPNKIIMALGLVGLSVSIGYMAYMRTQHERMGLYTAVDTEGQETLMKRPSRWD
ncbi:small integral membrane protein 8 [Neocloeon triangulifer]|uniref:small integral membrane protein 8 n=1 Tax=Neocloeon triangulifer TaxID=2078957 RepID=UPI00286F1FBA|nr:small integral membrane protein 8 [Neocloeon triangulifer]